MCFANQWNVFYIIEASVMKELNVKTRCVSCSMFIASKALFVNYVFSPVILSKFSLDYAGLKIAIASLTIGVAWLTSCAAVRFWAFDIL